MNLSLFEPSRLLAALPEVTEKAGEPFQILLPLGLILIFAKLFSLLARRVNLPQVIGYLVAGLFVGLLIFIPGQKILTTYTEYGLQFFSKIGVIFILFSAGLETDLKRIRKMGKAAMIITNLGVLVPLLFGFLLSFTLDQLTKSPERPYGLLAMYPTDATGAIVSTTPTILPVFTELFYGVILSATSVSITVATLKELGKVDTDVGTAIVSAAIIDDLIGVILLSLIISLARSGDAESIASGTDFVSMILRSSHLSSQTIEWLQIVLILIFMGIFFGLTIGLGHFVQKLFNYLSVKYPHHIRITLLAIGMCFLWSYVAEYFNIADITGAYLFGLILSSTQSKGYVDHRVDTISNNIFTPVFFALTASSMYLTSAKNFSWLFFLFGALWIVFGLLGKVVGAGIGAKISHFSGLESLIVGTGMMARAEVLVVCAQTGIDDGIIHPSVMPYVIGLILISSFLTPILLKVEYKGLAKKELAHPQAVSGAGNEPAAKDSK